MAKGKVFGRACGADNWNSGAGRIHTAAFSPSVRRSKGPTSKTRSPRYCLKQPTGALEIFPIGIIFFSGRYLRKCEGIDARLLGPAHTLLDC